MKKHYPLLLAFWVVCSSFFVSCDEDLNRCKITVTCTEGGKAKISKYFETSEDVLFGSEIEVVALPDEGYVFKGWYLGDSTEPISHDAVFIFVATKDITLIAKFVSSFINGHKYVDLGLPSGLLWATCNVGASTPEGCGGYYAWGETEEKGNYDLSTYKWCDGSEYTMTKYCTDSSYGTVDNKTVLDLEDDGAHVKWGGTWRMPTIEEQCELYNNCTWSWTTQNGVYGYKVTGPNSNSVFLPAAGYCNGTRAYDRGSYGYYWSSSLCGSNRACDLHFKSGGCGWYGDGRSYGLSVRPVSE